MSTINSAALTAHIVAFNLKGQEWAAQADNENGEFRCHAQYNTTPEYWAEYDVYTPADFDRCLALSELSDFHKSCHGYRPRDLDGLTMEQIQERLDSLSRYADSMQEQWEEDAKREAIWMAEQDAQYEEDDRIERAEQDGDYSDVNEAHRDEYATEQAPLGSFALVL
jgi:hypothetical protein